jgi:hypothetical protein
MTGDYDMKTVTRAELSNLRMVAGSEKKYSKAVIDGKLKEWVGIGWIELRDATAADKRRYPVVEG